MPGVLRNKRVYALLMVVAMVIAIVPAVSAADSLKWDLTLPSLMDTYKDYFMFGSVMEPGQTADASITNMYSHHYNAVTAENAMKPEQMSSKKGTYNFANADKIVKWAEANGVKVHGHTLIWHSQSAAWLNRNGKNILTRAEAKANMEEFIKTVVEHFKGKVISWDVVNEAFDDGGSSSKGWEKALRINAPWYQAYANGADTSKGESGADYIYDAFVLTRKYDPDATLYYNDYNEEMPNKREAIALMVESLNEKWKTDPRNTEPDRLLIEGIGMQSHFFTSGFSLKNVEDAIKRFIKTGAVLSVSELDVVGGSYSKMATGKEDEQAVIYKQLFELYVKYYENIERVTIWGKIDSQSWRKAGTPMLFDANGTAKKAFGEVISVAEANKDSAPPTTKPEEPEKPSEPVTPILPAAATAKPSSQTLKLDGVTKDPDKYDINGNNYFKLRDIASLLSGTDAQFDVGYDNAKAIVTITTGKAYTPDGNENGSKGTTAKDAKLSTDKVMLNGAEEQIGAYRIDGSNYFKLRDLGEKLGFGVDYDAATDTIIITTK